MVDDWIKLDDVNDGIKELPVCWPKTEVLPGKSMNNYPKREILQRCQIIGKEDILSSQDSHKQSLI